MKPVPATPHNIRLELSYKVSFTAHEMWFFNHFIPGVMVSEAHKANRLLELCNVQELFRRKQDKFRDGQACKLKMTTAELLALKRLLLNTEVPTAWKHESETILAKLDQLTVGIR
ncbi:hypothetical protein SAMN05444359_12641 [Neolewinella agarilytica]|uniref:Uncharacterized protein n=2 Tax=Neolewinella agarilytica TaxID=478744 RepID=A0A1H9LYQ0_9BACT|nr:hypothetical protein SAMN05444359_12641 [Neolewinella agarilytica]